MSIIIPVMLLGLLGAVFGLWLGFVQKVFLIKKDPRAEQILSLLPGANCGACGQAGCFGLAEALVREKPDTIPCPVLQLRERQDIANILGVKAEMREKVKAVLLCGGGNNCKDNFQYRGIKDCNAAILIMNGPKACLFGCVGLGSCVTACPFEAISMGKNNLPVIDSAKCTGCGKCVKACPKGVLALAPCENTYHVKCNSKDKGPDTIKACKTGCIACGKCVKACPENAIEIKDNLAVIDYKKCINCGKCEQVCPTKAIEKEI